MDSDSISGGFSNSSGSVQSVIKRLQLELKNMMKPENGDLGISAFPDEDNQLKWLAAIDGPKDTPYEGLTFRLSLLFPENYPMRPPQVIFVTPCFHPNVNTNGDICLDMLQALFITNGDICLDTLQDKWTAALDIRTLLLSIQSLLTEANLKSPFDQYAATLWGDKEAFKKEVVKRRGED